MWRGGLGRVRLYDTRAASLTSCLASCVTWLANKRAPDHILARWAGHTNVGTAKTRYVRPDVEDLRPAAEAWGGLVEAQTPLT